MREGVGKKLGRVWATKFDPYKCVNTVQKLLFFALCLCLLFIQAKKCIDRYWTYETGISIRVYETNRQTFPALTICTSYNNAYKAHVLQKYGTSIAEYRKGHLLQPLPPGMNMIDLHLEATRNFSEIFIQVKVWTVDADETGSFATLLNEYSDEVWREHRTLVFGRCYSLVIPAKVVNLGIQSIMMDFYDNPYVFVHHPGQFLDPDTKSKIVTVSGQKTFVDLDYELVYLLENSDYDRAFICTHEMNFQYDECFYTQIAKVMMNEFGCIGHVINLRNASSFNFSTCDLSRFNRSQQDHFLQRQKTTWYNAVNTLCPAPCGVLAHDLGIPDFDPIGIPDGQSYVKLYFKRNVKVTKFVYSYKILSLIAEIGGYSGLLLGFSIFHAASASVSKLVTWIKRAF